MIRRSHIRAPFVLALLALLAVGCDGEVPSRSVPWSGLSGKGDGTDWIEGNPVRLALAQVREDLPQTDYWSLLSEGEVDASAGSSDAEISGFVRRGLLVGLSGGEHKHGDQHLRVWRYHLGGGINPTSVIHGDIRMTVPFRLRADSSVEFARTFASSSKANLADAPTLMDLPHDTDSALALPTGTVVSIPVEARMSVDVNGRFLTRFAVHTPELGEHVTASAVGSTSGVRQGTLLVEGDLLVQVIRLGDERVRLRVATGSVVGANGTLGFHAGASVFYRFIPSATIDRARAIKTRVERAHKRIESLGTVEERLERLRARLDSKVDTLLMAPVPFSDVIEGFAEGPVAGAFDVAFDMASSAPSLEAMESAVLDRTERLLDHALNAWDKYVEPTLAAVKRFSSRTYRLNATVTLSAEAARRVRTVADYEFDLSDEAARRAFDRAISGRALWMDANAWFGGGSSETARLSDLTLADDLASADASAEHPRVIRHATAMGDLRTRHFGVKVSGLWMSSGMDWSETDNIIGLVDEDGDHREWEYRAWQFDRKVSWLGDQTSTSFASGAFLEEGDEDLYGGGYWFSWHKAFAASAYTPVAESLGEFINLLGPVAVSAGMPALYDGEHDGRVSATLDVVFSGDALDYVFDPLLTSDALLWRVFGEVAETFDNRYGLPTLMSPFRPKGLEEIEGGVEACEKVAYHFGGWYCFYFADTFLPALREAQESSDATARLAFLERFYEKGLFGNPVGSRLMVRYVASLMMALGLGEEISLRAEVRNDEDDSESASPSLERGDPEALALIETMTPEGLK